MCDEAYNVVLSCRVRLARNYHDLPFNTEKNPENAERCIERACKGVSETDYVLHRLRDMNEYGRLAMVERHLISRDQLKRAATGAALVRKDQRVSIMINEEDHLRIQAFCDALDIERAAQEAFAVEEQMEQICTFSYDPHLGYLTSCPTNTGTGMRASLMLHLPMLTHYKQMGTVNQSVAKLGLTTRGIYGEGSEALGDLYQVSNQVALGRTEDELIEAVTAVGRQLIDMELSMRKRALAESALAVKDDIFRSYGLLRYARRMDEKEFMQHWSHLRLGSALGLLPVQLSCADKLLTLAQNAHVRRSSPTNASVDAARCQIIHKVLEPNA